MTRITALLAVLFVAALTAGSATASLVTTVGEDHPDKVFVCKYVGTPGDDERLQTGQNPISVSVNAIPEGASVGAFFADAQGRSFVLAFDTGQPEPSVDNCPPPDNPPDIEVTAGVTFTEATCAAGPSFSFVRGPGLGFYLVEGPLVDGKPVVGGTYTITATANEGYVLTGQTVWVHTFAAAPTNCNPPFRCPDGGPPEANPVDPNDNCKRPTPPVTTTPPAVTPPVVTPPVVTPPAVSPPKAKPPVKKTTVKVKPPVKKKTVVKKKGPHVCVPLKDGTERRWWKGGNGMPAGCYAVIRGSG